MANVAGRDLIGVVDDIRDLIDTDVEIPPGYCVEYGGQFESAASAGTRLPLLGVVVVVGIFLLLVAAFGSARDAFLVMLNLPLALIGGVVVPRSGSCHSPSLGENPAARSRPPWRSSFYGVCSVRRCSTCSSCP